MSDMRRREFTFGSRLRAPTRPGAMCYSRSKGRRHVRADRPQLIQNSSGLPQGLAGRSATRLSCRAVARGQGEARTGAAAG